MTTCQPSAAVTQLPRHFTLLALSRSTLGGGYHRRAALHLGWAAKLQNVTTHTGDFKIEYSSGSSKAISSGADTLSRLLDSTAKTDSDDWNTVNYKDFPPITFSPCLCKHTFGDDKLSTRDDLTAHLHRYGSQEVSQEE